MFFIHTTHKGFVHIPRTAGSFIQSQCQFLDGFEKHHLYHASIPGEFLNYEWHTLVRDPVERFISLYRFNQMNQKMSTHTGDFNSFINHVYQGFEHHTRPQISFINEQTHCHLNVEKCVQALGGTVTGVRINQSKGPVPTISEKQRMKIKQLYSQDVELFYKLQSLQHYD